jgi:glycosyltransferase involved in cell wall biosynthesis
MRITIVTDAWLPQVNGVVTTLLALDAGLKQRGHTPTWITPEQFDRRPCPGYPEIELAKVKRARFEQLMDASDPEVIHVATEGPLGWAARRYCTQRGLSFTTAFHTKFPDILKAAVGVPLWLGYALFRHFHGASSGVMVPTPVVLGELRQRGFAQLREWTHGVDTQLFHPDACPARDRLPTDAPRFLYVGRVSYEKNIQAFLETDLPGSKWVCGVGPLEASLRRKYPDVHWLGILPKRELAAVYASADVMVFPSKADTFGLVMLEAMACGTPVAAYPVPGPMDVMLGQPDGPGGVMRENLREAALAALKLDRAAVRRFAEDFSWDAAVDRFASFLVPALAAPPMPQLAEQP